MIGINDLHRYLGGEPGFYDAAGYEDLYRKILDRAAEETGAKLIILTPFYMSQAQPGEENGWRGRVMEIIPLYIEAAKRVADDYGARLVDTHAMFAEQLNHHRADAFGDEPVAEPVGEVDHRLDDHRQLGRRRGRDLQRVGRDGRCDRRLHHRQHGHDHHSRRQPRKQHRRHRR